MDEDELKRALESVTDPEKKLILVQAIINETKDFLDDQKPDSLSPPQLAFLPFLKRFIDCVLAIRLLKSEEFDRQAWMVSRHALECTVYMGALASMPECFHAIVAQESYQRIEIRRELAKSGVISEEERRRWDETNKNEIEEYLPDLDRMRRKIRRIKVDRGWKRSRTERHLNLADMALCSEAQDIFPTLQRFLSPSVHVFFGNLVDDHVLGIEGSKIIEDDEDLANPSNDAVAMIGVVTNQIDKLFETDLHSSTDSLLGQYWPATKKADSEGAS